MNKQYTKDEHFVPVFYLEQFQDSTGRVWVYDRIQNKPFQQKPENICYKKNLYETASTDDSDNGFLFRNMFEDNFCQDEGSWKTLLRVLIDNCHQSTNVDGKLICSSEEQRSLVELVANLIARNPWTLQRADLDNTTEARKLPGVQALENAAPSMGITDFDSLIKAANKFSHFNMTYGTQRDIVDIIQTMNFWFVYNENHDFITSCYPVLLGTQDGGSSLSFAMLPISPDILVYFGTDEASKEYHNRLMYNSKISYLQKYLYLSLYPPARARFLVAKEKAHLEHLDNPAFFQNYLMALSGQAVKEVTPSSARTIL